MISTPIHVPVASRAERTYYTMTSQRKAAEADKSVLHEASKAGRLLKRQQTIPGHMYVRQTRRQLSGSRPWRVIPSQRCRSADANSGTPNKIINASRSLNPHCTMRPSCHFASGKCSRVSHLTPLSFTTGPNTKKQLTWNLGFVVSMI